MESRLLAQLHPLCDLRADVRESLLRQAQLRAIAAQALIFTVGDTQAEAYYLLNGRIAYEDSAGKTLAELSADEPAAVFRLAHQIPRRCSARALSDCEVLMLDDKLLDVMLTWDQTSSLEVGELHGAVPQNHDWMTRLLQTRCFLRVPPANLHSLFLRMQPVRASKGEVVVRQGAQGDSYYVIAEGQAEVLRETTGSPLLLANLAAGDCFGEAALLSGEPRDATVRMLSDGQLMRLARKDFLELLREPFVPALTWAEAQAKIRSGKAQLLDVRMASEARLQPVAGALNLPLYLLRMKLRTLATDTAYIVCCSSGKRSEVATYVLTQSGFDAYALAGGVAAINA